MTKKPLDEVEVEVEQGSTSCQTHYRSYRERIFTSGGATRGRQL